MDQLGGLLPIDERLHAAFEHIRSWKGHYLARVFAVNVVLEGDGLAEEHRRLKNVLCPLFRALNRRVMLDEQRHHSFGMLMLSWMYPALSPPQRREMKDWTQQLAVLWKNARGSEVRAEADDFLAEQSPRRKLVQEAGAHVSVPV